MDEFLQLLLEGPGGASSGISRRGRGDMTPAGRKKIQQLITSHSPKKIRCYMRELKSAIKSGLLGGTSEKQREWATHVKKAIKVADQVGEADTSAALDAIVNNPDNREVLRTDVHFLIASTKYTNKALVAAVGRKYVDLQLAAAADAATSKADD